MIDDMVNLSTFHAPAVDRPTNLVFKSGAQKRLFAILLADVLAKPNDKAFPFGFPASDLLGRETDRTYVSHLEAVGRDPILGPDSSGLVTATAALPIG